MSTMTSIINILATGTERDTDRQRERLGHTYITLETETVPETKAQLAFSSLFHVQT